MGGGGRDVTSTSVCVIHSVEKSLHTVGGLLQLQAYNTGQTTSAISVAAPIVWNSLPSGIRDSSSTHTFRRLVKTHCFQQAFGSP